MFMIYILFIAAAIITVITAVKLSTYADVIGERTKLGGMMAGVLLLAGATSLPEVTTSITAIVVNNPDIAVSNVFGSNLFNLFILAAVDLVYRRKRILQAADSSHLSTAVLSIVMTASMAAVMVFPIGFSVLGIGVEMLLLAFLYAGGMIVISRAGSNLTPLSADEPEPQHNAISLRHAKRGFAVAAVIILAAGSALSVTGDLIAQATGISSSFVGAFLIAGATSLPELVTVIVAIQLANHSMALGNILGSNVFNMLILIIIDAVYRGGPVLSIVSPAVLAAAAGVLILNAVVIGAVMMVNRKKPAAVYSLPSMLVILVYFLSSYAIFSFS
ncbi:sodium:calcium antiporter [Bacillus daqingensis]|uniref:Sodium:calcium antiporter n=2 Tax=Bacillus daqingensis TaxID=872396 RepID=A0ABV9NR44_9BACI